MRTLRTERGWSQEEFAYQCGLHRTYIGHVELGKKNISFNNLVTIAATLGLTLSDLFSGLEDGSGTPEEHPPGSARRQPPDNGAGAGHAPPTDRRPERPPLHQTVARALHQETLTSLSEYCIAQSVTGQYYRYVLNSMDIQTMRLICCYPKLIGGLVRPVNRR